MSLENIFALLTLLVAIVATAGGFYSVYSARKTARQKAILVFFEEYKNNKQIFEALRLFYDYDKGKKYVIPKNSVSDPNEEKIYALLNKYEVFAVGLKHKIYDEKMFIEALAIEAIRAYEFYEPVITHARDTDPNPTNNPDRRAFTAFEDMAKRYKPLLIPK